MREQVILTHSISGGQTAGANKKQFLMPSGMWRLFDVRARLGTAPTGAAFLIDINKNGTTIFTDQAQRTTIAIAANDSGAHRSQNVNFNGGDRLGVDIDQIGSTVAGSDLDLTLGLERA